MNQRQMSELTQSADVLGKRMTRQLGGGEFPSDTQFEELACCINEMLDPRETLIREGRKEDAWSTLTLPAS